MFSERIRLLRMEKGMTQAQVGESVGLSARGYQNLELGAKPKYETMLSIAEFFDVSLDWLAGRTERREVNR